MTSSSRPRCTSEALPAPDLASRQGVERGQRCDGCCLKGSCTSIMRGLSEWYCLRVEPSTVSKMAGLCQG